MEKKAKSNKLLVTIGLLFLSLPIIFLFVIISFGSILGLMVTDDEDKKRKENTISTEYGYICNPNGMDAEQEQRFKDGFIGRGVLANKADAYLQYAEQYQIDPVLLAAISFHETGNGTSDAVRYKNNTGGLIIGGSLYHFNTIEDSLNSQAKTIRNRINDVIAKDGEYSLEGLRDIYAPVGATNDPTNLNQHWLNGIINFASQLGGFSMNCELKYENSSVNAVVDGASLPMNKIQFTSPYGMRFHPIYKEWRLHAGADFACSINDSIYTIWEGTVIASKFHFSWGNYVAVVHPNGESTLYAHLNDRLVENGAKVSTGQEIGKCGSTGASTGSHLHLEYRKDANISSIASTKDIAPTITKIQQNMSKQVANE